MTTETLGEAIVDNLARADIRAEVVPWHGAVIVHLSDTEALTTGYSGWDWGGLSVLRDGTYEDTGEGVEFPGVTEDCEDATVIASGIAKAVAAR